MSIGPILPGRLPNSFASVRFTEQIQAGRLQLRKLEDQLTTGQQYLTPSENPAAALTTIILQTRLERTQQYQSNIQTDRSLISATENALSSATDGINQAKSIILQGIGDNTSQTEKNALATEVDAILQQVLNAANTKFRGRYLFGGTQNADAPFEQIGNGQVLYSGNAEQIESHVEADLRIVNNLSGQAAFNVLTTVDSSDLDVALTLDTRIDDLYAGSGVALGEIDITIQDGGTTEIRRIDLTPAESINDLKLLIEDAFAGSSVSVTVDVDPASNSGLRLTPASGTVTVADVTGSRVATELGITSAATAQINGGDLNPNISIHTQLADLNGGSGIGSTSGTGLLIQNGDKSGVIDLSSAVTVEDLFNELRLANLDLDVGLNSSGDGIAISSRVAGANLSIGENGGTNATSLGIRTLTADTQLSELNLGIGAPFASGEQLEITRRDGTNVSVDVSSAVTIQDVLDSINAIDPGNLTASLNSVGNGISILDNSGTGALTIVDNTVSEALGLAGTESGSNPAVPLTGQDPNPQQSGGLIGILSALETALRNGDDRELTRLSTALDTEADRIVGVVGELGTRLRTLDEVENRLADQEIQINEDLSNSFDADLTEVLTNFVAQQQALEASYRVAGEAFRLNLLSFL